MLDLRFCLQISLPAWTRFSNRALDLPSCVTPSFKRLKGGIGLSTDCPSPTPCGLGLGPDLPWADEPSPGILRLSAGRILTCLFAYLYRHSHFCTLHYSFRYSFAAYRTLPYPDCEIASITVAFAWPLGTIWSQISILSFYRIFATSFCLFGHTGNFTVCRSFGTMLIAPLHFRRKVT